MSYKNPAQRTQNLDIPFHSVLYDQATHNTLIKAQECFNDNFPMCVIENSEQITNHDLLHAAGRVEAFLYNFSMAFGVVGPDGSMLHMTYSDGPTKKSETPVRVAELFCMLSIMLNHPAYQILRTVYSVIYSRTKAYAALRDVRWAFKQTKNRLSVTGKRELYENLLIMLRAFVQSSKESSDSPSTVTAVAIFDDFTKSGILDEDKFAAVVMLAINVLESSGRNGRPISA